MKKGMKSAGILALSAVLACGALGTLAGCGGGGDKPKGAKDELTVSIFCNAADATTNQKICDEWAAWYSEEYKDELGGMTIKVSLANNTDKGEYFKQLDKDWSTGSTADVIYLAPRYVRAYAERNNILDLSSYLSAEDIALASGVWQNGISYYGYKVGQRDSYKMGRAIEVKDGKFVTATNEATTGDDKGTEVGLYGLPKDYSNFSTGYNRLFFTQELKDAYTSTKATTVRNVQGPYGEGGNEWTSKRVYKGGSSSRDGEGGVITVDGKDANIINIGVPTTYKPYNFFHWNSFADALNGGDPMAIMSEAMGGYTVTIPGFPDEVFDVTQEDFNAVYENAPDIDSMNVPYNNKTAHVTYTYAEYGALIWAVTYYLNTFAWQNPAGPLSGRGGTGGTSYAGDSNQAIYGGEQYEGIAGATGSVLYLLPWLAANDADLINDLSTLTSQNIGNVDLTDVTNWREAAGTKTYTTSKRTIVTGENDELVKKEIQYGHNSQNFIETYAAFLAIGSDWNGNPSGDTDSDQRGENGNGWGYFRSGRSLFYGAGSWDAATRNDVHSDILDFGQMPTPVAEKYALYSEIKDANYQKAIYSNDPAKAVAGSADEGKQRATLSEGKKAYSDPEIVRNQLRRQDKWAARMDTVGYAVAAKVAKYTGEHEWKAKAAVSLTARLTINEAAQETLLYAGAQLPNFKAQCVDFVNYKTKGADGAFAEMLTPEGFWDTPEGNGKAVWDYYYQIALDMEEKARGGSSQTVEQYLADKKHSTDGKTAADEAIRYDKNYKDTKLSAFTGEGNARLAFAMKVLRMVSYREKDRDLNIRMQYGLNGVRDSSMYTYKEDWMGSIDARGNTSMLAYLLQKPLDSKMTDLTFLVPGNFIQMNPSDTSKVYSYMTPAVWCFKQASAAQALLADAVKAERDAWVGK